jgi:hypothetical protein
MQEPLNEGLEQRVRFLRAAGTAALGHPGGMLLDHLLGTRALLVAWGERPALCDAGLFHSVYGTEHYRPAAISRERRAEVAALIGTEAEGLAWLFAVLDRESFDRNVGQAEGLRVRDRLTGQWLPLTPSEFRDLVTLSFANTLEALPRVSWRVRRACRAYLTSLRAVAPPAAQRALDDASGRRWQFWR